MSMRCFLLLSFLFELATSRSFPFLQHTPRIALTRDLEGNRQLEQLLNQKGYQTFSLPCVEFSDGPDNIKDQLHHSDIIAVTSPQVSQSTIILNCLKGALHVCESISVNHPMRHKVMIE